MTLVAFGNHRSAERGAARVVRRTASIGTLVFSVVVRNRVWIVLAARHWTS
jgi:hypothetical protein